MASQSQESAGRDSISSLSPGIWSGRERYGPGRSRVLPINVRKRGSRGYIIYSQVLPHVGTIDHSLQTELLR
ncbi:hypothetical protein PVAG01_03220 [Phlyctema vagabunda]|uniref:Uncharacterized protein n=1 Tax=Phlyctema vagabunda TaxID=108571 RepID=A0ABR4PT33_9HELO